VIAATVRSALARLHFNLVSPPDVFRRARRVVPAGRRHDAPIIEACLELR